MDRPDLKATKTTIKIVRKGSDVVLIKLNEGKTYADVLGTLKLKVNPEDTQTVISTIRKTRDGGVLLELGEGTKDMTLFRESVHAAHGQSCQVRSISRRITVEIRDLDSLATVDDVMDALKCEIPGTNDLKVYVFDPNVREQRMAVAEMDETAATALLQKGRIKIGWVYCRVRPRIIVPRCYRCQGYGHLRLQGSP